MDIDGEKLEQVVLALFQMNLSDDSERRAWKSLPWSVMDSLHQKGYISDPATKNKSVWLSEEEAKLSRNSSRSFLLQRKSVQWRYELASDRQVQHELYRSGDLPGAGTAKDTRIPTVRTQVTENLVV